MRIPERAIFYQLLMLCLVLAVPFGHVQGQTIRSEPVPSWQMNSTIGAEEVTISGTVEGPIAHIQVAQTLRNRSSQIAEGVVLFPIPAEATSSGFRLTSDGGVTVEGSVLDKKSAVDIYQEYVRQVRDPAILEYMGADLYRARVFPIEPHSQATITLSYDLLVRTDHGLRRLQLPLRTFAGNHHAEATISVQLDFFSEYDLRPLYSPTHELLVDRANAGRTHVEVQPERTGGRLEILYGTSGREIEIDVVSYQPVGEDGYVALLINPPIESMIERIVAKDVILVLDVSGSMEGEKLVQAKKAARYIVDNLNPADRFNILAFSTGVRFWDGWLRSVDDGVVGSAHAWLDRLSASGSTDIHSSLLEAMRTIGTDPLSSERPAYLLFVTDGLPTQGETDPLRILQSVSAAGESLPNLRLFTFGVGYDVNTDLLNELGRQNRGRSSYVTPDETIDGVVEEFFAKISSPVLTNVAIDFGENIVVDDIYPASVPDLFASEQLVVLGRYHGGSTSTIQLTGMVNGEHRIYRYPTRVFAERGGDPAIARLWATRKVGSLLEQIRLYGPNPEIVDAVVDLSLRFGIMTPYTAYLVEEPAHTAKDSTAADQDSEPGYGGDIDPLARANALALDVAQESAAAPASGEAAVIESEKREALVTANYAIDTADVTHLHGKTFIRQYASTYELGIPAGIQLWVDAEYSAGMEVEVIVFGSERYFEVANDAQLFRWLSLSDELLLVLDDEHAIVVTAQDR